MGKASPCGSSSHNAIQFIHKDNQIYSVCLTAIHQNSNAIKYIDKDKQNKYNILV